MTSGNGKVVEGRNEKTKLGISRYRTIVADPPWALEWNANVGNGRSGRKGLPYDTLTVEQIAALGGGRHG